MTRKQIAIVSAALASLPVCELAYALAHRYEPPFAVMVVAALWLLVDWARMAPATAEHRCACAEKVEAMAAAPKPEIFDRKLLVSMLRVEALRIIREAGSVTIDDLRAVTARSGLSIPASAIPSIFRGLRKIDERPSSNPSHHGRPIGVYAIPVGGAA